ncbi:helix-turn-helix domain-containing protein (plasmid) [Aneurinibacillus sp. Ricciae_BoGa-3]|uniref:helix-turn-helix domain-containing protein n=1 Tax=Aneurinibacillus sp. Ricciae_BoGa-3 TaxID=3022697 RepID=UPI0023424D17|nr:helix-turn-helix domain-containing protein [Aneurinibacillus sp. Ricciae_BoGa-3]WCK57566.1 helix-turn-helix domain-containing protein [Aneurinibacillus sp. Ricciae_BoGa-3]
MTLHANFRFILNQRNIHTLNEAKHCSELKGIAPHVIEKLWNDDPSHLKMKTLLLVSKALDISVFDLLFYSED